MVGYILVVDSPAFATTGVDGMTVGPAYVLAH